MNNGTQQNVKETFEEAALSFLPHSEVEHDTDFIIGFEFGAKWQAKQMEKERIISAQMDMFHFLNNLTFGMQYLEKREKAESFSKQWYEKTYGGNND